MSLAAIIETWCSNRPSCALLILLILLLLLLLLLLVVVVFCVDMNLLLGSCGLDAGVEQI